MFCVICVSLVFLNCVFCVGLCFNCSLYLLAQKLLLGYYPSHHIMYYCVAYVLVEMYYVCDE